MRTTNCLPNRNNFLSTTIQLLNDFDGTRAVSKDPGIIGFHVTLYISVENNSKSKYDDWSELNKCSLTWLYVLALCLAANVEFLIICSLQYGKIYQYC